MSRVLPWRLLSRGVATSSLLAMLLTGCKSNEEQEQPPPEESVEQDVKARAEQELAAERARRQKVLDSALENIRSERDLDEKEYEVLVLSLDTCEVDAKRGYVDSECQAFGAIKKARSRRNTTVPDQPEMWRLIADRNLSSQSPAVRIYSAQLLTSAFGAKTKMHDRLLDASREEEEPAVLQAIVRGLRMHAGENPAIAKRLIELSRHDDEHVREAVIIGLTSIWSVGSEGTLERAIEMVQSDPSMSVRKTGCANLGSRADDRALPLLREYASWPPRDEALYGDCFRGLVGMWSAPVPHKRPSKAAYDLTIELLEATPRSDKHPAWVAFSNLGWANKPALLERAPYVDLDRLRAVLMDIVEDKQANWLGRNAAISALLRLDGTKKDLERVRSSAYSAPVEKGSPDQYVLNKLNSEIEKLDRVKAKKHVAQ